MGILLFLVGLLALGSGAYKLRARVRSVYDVTGFTVAELAAGALTVLGSGLGLARMRPLAWTVVAGVMLLVLLSGISLVRSNIRRIEQRERSEGARLKSYLRSRGS